MEQTYEMKPVARIQSAFPSKFGVPRQSGIVTQGEARIVFEKEFRDADAVRGLENFSHLWLIWYFSLVPPKKWSPTVRPPRLGGNTRMGVFATRSPFRPNRIGLSSVKIERIEYSVAEGPIIIVSGADLVDGTPILDIKPYLPYTDLHPDAKNGFADIDTAGRLQVEYAQGVAEKLPDDTLQVLTAVLAQDPRPSYQEDEREYGFPFEKYEVRFLVKGDKLTVIDITE